ncbi:MAG: PorP/SprF family type IX secretion system membrane protein [Microscillaceae bacterium]|nr:PorP/SprF family type IX secretion system membrane protein [Microscillaceae bacterium]
MYRNTLLLIISVLLCCSLSQAQVVPLQNQFVVNPYMYNPAWAGNSDYMQFHGGFKKQWLGIEGSPSVATLSFEAPLNESLNLGANLINVTEGPWNYLNAQFGASYQIPLGYAGDHILRFGMSLGFRYSLFNINELDDPDDPALAGMPESTFTPDGSFGLAYQFRNLQVGVSMPRFTEAIPLSSEITITPWYHLIGSASYKFDIGISGWAITPTLVYHREQEIEDQIEGFLKVSYQDKYWGGGSYRQDYGVTAFLGAEINEMFSLNYFYTFGNLSSPVANQSHELTLRVRIGSKKRGDEPLDEIEDETPSTSEVTKTETTFTKTQKTIRKDSTSASVTPPINKKEDPDADNPIFQVAPDVNLNAYDKSLEIHYPFDPDKMIGRTAGGYAFDLEKGNYISMGKFTYSSDAEPLMKEMGSKGLNPRLIYLRAERLYYVYVLQKPDLDWSRKIILSLRKLKGFEKAHLVVLE